MTTRSLFALVLACVFSLGCTTRGDARDPLEPFNRGIYQFNETVDKAVLKPVAKGYEAVVPFPVRTGIGNFFSNLNDFVIAVNNLLQFKFKNAASDTGRVLLNSTAGILGVIDVATAIGLEKHNEDFGQTLGRYGVGTGPYLVLPFFGPSDVRDAAGLAVDVQIDPLLNYDELSLRDKAIGARVIDNRAALFDAETVFDEAAIDRYDFLRNSYLQRRHSLVYDGDPPRERLDPLLEDPEPVPAESGAPAAPK